MKAKLAEWKGKNRDRASVEERDSDIQRQSLFWKSEQYNLCRSPSLHSSVSGSGCQFVCCCLSVPIQSVTEPSQEDMAALVRSSSWVTNWGQPKGHQECLQRGIFFCQQSVTRVCSLNVQIHVHHEEAADQLPVDIIKPSNVFTVCQPNVSLSLSQQRFDWSFDCKKKKKNLN